MEQTKTVAIVTGAASGIGREMAVQMARRGHHLVLADINESGLREVAAAIAANGASVTTRPLDVADAAAVQALVDSVMAEHGRIDYLFNIAGVGLMAEVRDMSIADWQRIVSINLMGVIHGAHAAYGVMIRQGFGHIVNMASLAGLVGSPPLGAYATTKAGVVALSGVLRTEGAALGVKVSVLCPSFVESGIYDALVTRHVTQDQVRALISLPILPTDSAVRMMLRGVDRNLGVIVVPGYARWMWRLMRWAPGLARLAGAKALADFRKVRQASG